MENENENSKKELISLFIIADITYKTNYVHIARLLRQIHVRVFLGVLTPFLRANKLKLISSFRARGFMTQGLVTATCCSHKIMSSSSLQHFVPVTCPMKFNELNSV